MKIIETDEDGLITEKSTIILLFIVAIVALVIGLLAPVLGKLFLEITGLAIISWFYDWVDKSNNGSLVMFFFMLWMALFIGYIMFSLWLWMPCVPMIK